MMAARAWSLWMRSVARSTANSITTRAVPALSPPHHRRVATAPGQHRAEVTFRRPWRSGLAEGSARVRPATSSGRADSARTGATPSTQRPGNSPPGSWEGLPPLCQHQADDRRAGAQPGRHRHGRAQGQPLAVVRVIRQRQAGRVDRGQPRSAPRSRRAEALGVRPGGRGGAERIGGHVLTAGVAERRAGRYCCRGPMPRIVVAGDRQPLAAAASAPRRPGPGHTLRRDGGRGGGGGGRLSGTRGSAHRLAGHGRSACSIAGVVSAKVRSLERARVGSICCTVTARRRK